MPLEHEVKIVNICSWEVEHKFHDKKSRFIQEIGDANMFSSICSWTDRKHEHLFTKWESFNLFFKFCSVHISIWCSFWEKIVPSVEFLFNTNVKKYCFKKKTDQENFFAKWVSKICSFSIGSGSKYREHCWMNRRSNEHLARTCCFEDTVLWTNKNMFSFLLTREKNMSCKFVHQIQEGNNLCLKCSWKCGRKSFSWHLFTRSWTFSHKM